MLFDMTKNPIHVIGYSRVRPSELFSNVSYRCGWYKSVNGFLFGLRKMFIRLSNTVFVTIGVNSCRYIFSTKPFLACKNRYFQFPFSHGFKGGIWYKFLSWSTGEPTLGHRVSYIRQICSWFKMERVTTNRVITSVHKKLFVRYWEVVKKHPCPSVCEVGVSIFRRSPPSIPVTICSSIPFPAERRSVHTNFTPKQHLGFKSLVGVLNKMSIHVGNISMRNFAFQLLSRRREQCHS